jgi:hypothetical protein
MFKTLLAVVACLCVTQVFAEERQYKAGEVVSVRDVDPNEVKAVQVAVPQTVTKSFPAEPVKVEDDFGPKRLKAELSKLDEIEKAWRDGEQEKALAAAKNAVKFDDKNLSKDEKKVRQKAAKTAEKERKRRDAEAKSVAFDAGANTSSRSGYVELGGSTSSSSSSSSGIGHSSSSRSSSSSSVGVTTTVIPLQQ